MVLRRILLPEARFLEAVSKNSKSWRGRKSIPGANLSSIRRISFCADSFRSRLPCYKRTGVVSLRRLQPWPARLSSTSFGPNRENSRQAQCSKDLSHHSESCDLLALSPSSISWSCSPLPGIARFSFFFILLCPQKLFISCFLHISTRGRVLFPQIELSQISPVKSETLAPKPPHRTPSPWHSRRPSPVSPRSHRRPHIIIVNGPRFRPVIVDDALGAG